LSLITGSLKTLEKICLGQQKALATKIVCLKTLKKFFEKGKKLD